MCYTLTTYVVCDDCGKDVKTLTTDKICPSDARCAERKRQPRRQEERISNRLCDNCQKYTDRVYHSRVSDVGRSNSRNETGRIHTIKTNDSGASTIRDDRRRDTRDSHASKTRGDRRRDAQDSLASAIRCGRRRGDSDSRDDPDATIRGHSRNRRDTVSSLTDKFSDLHASEKYASGREFSVRPLDTYRGSDSRAGELVSGREFSVRPLESDRSTISSSTYRGSDSTYRSDSTYCGPDSTYHGSSSSSSAHYAPAESVRGFTVITSTPSQKNLIDLRDILGVQYHITQKSISRMYANCHGSSLTLPAFFDRDYPDSKLYRTSGGEFYVDLYGKARR